MTDQKFNLDLELGYDDVSQGINAMAHDGKRVMDVFVKLAEGVETAFTKVGERAKSVPNLFNQLEKAAERVFKKLDKDVADLERSIRQADMGHWAKQADKYGERIKAAHQEVARLHFALEDAHATDEQRLKTAQQIERVQAQIVQLTKAQGKAENLAKLAEGAKQAKDLFTGLDKVLNSVDKNLQQITQALAEGDMAPWEQQAARYAASIKESEQHVQQLQQQLQAAGVSDKDRLAIQEKIAQVQQKINQLQQAQGKSVGLAQLAESAGKAKELFTGLDKVLKGVDSSLEAIEAAITGNDMEPWEQQAAAYAKQIDAARAGVAELNEQLKQAQLTDEDRLAVQEKIVAARRQISQLEQAQGKNVALAQLAEEAERVRKAIGGIDQILERTRSQAAGVAKAIRQFGMDDVERQADNYAEALEQGKQEIAALEAQSKVLVATDTERVMLAQKLKQAHHDIAQLAGQQAIHLKQMKDAEQAALNQKVGIEAKQGLQELTMTSGIASAAIGLAMREASKEWAGLEGDLTSFSAITKGTEQQVESFKNTAYSLTVLGKTSDEISNLGVELSKAGLSADAVEFSLGTMVKASVGTKEELGMVGEVIDNVRTQFGLSVGEIERVANGVVLTANATKVSVADIGESYKYLGTSAAQANQPLEDTNAVLVLLGDSGIKASMAGNGMQNAFLRMTDPKVRDAFKKIGVDVTDGHGRIRQMTDILMDLKKGLNGFSDVDKSAWLKNQFGEVALNPMLALLGKTEARIREVRKTTQDWQGTLDELSSRMSRGFAFNMNQMLVALDTFKKQVGESLDPILTPIMAVLTMLLQAFGKLPGPIKTMIALGIAAAGATLGLASALGLAYFGGIALTKSLGSVANQLLIYAGKTVVAEGANLSLAGSFTAIKLAAANAPAILAKFATQAVTSLTSVGRAALTASLPLLPFIALAAALYLAWELNLGGFRDIMQNAWAVVQDIFGNITKFIEDHLSQNQIYWFTVWESIQDMLFGVLAIIDKGLRLFFGILDKSFKAISSFMVGDFAGAWQAIVNIFDSATGGLSKNITAWLQNIGQAFSSGIGGIVDIANAMWDAFTDPSKRAGAIERIGAGFKKMWEGLKDAATASANLMGDVIGKVEQAAQQLKNQPRDGRAIWNNSSLGKMLDGLGKQGVNDKPEVPKPDPTRTGLLEDKSKDKAGDALLKWAQDQAKDAHKRAEDDKNREIKRINLLDDAALDLSQTTETMSDAAALMRQQIAQTAIDVASDKGKVQQIARDISAAGVNLTVACGAAVDAIGDASKLIDFTALLKKGRGDAADYTRVFQYAEQLVERGLAEKLPISQMQAGDMVVGMNPTWKGKGSGHVGWAVNKNEVVHNSSSQRQIVRDEMKDVFVTNRPDFDPKNGGELFVLRLNQKAFDESELLTGGKTKALKPTPAPATQPAAPAKPAAASKASESFITQLKGEEGFKSKAYWDVDGWAVGYGSHDLFKRGHGGKTRQNTTIDKKTADLVLRDYLANAEKAILALGRDFNQHQFDALMGFVYNAGVNVFTDTNKGKQIAAALKAGNDKAAMDVLQTYDNGGALRDRRNREIALFNKPVTPGSTPATVSAGSGGAAGADAKRDALLAGANNDAVIREIALLKGVQSKIGARTDTNAKAFDFIKDKIDGLETEQIKADGEYAAKLKKATEAIKKDEMDAQMRLNQLEAEINARDGKVMPLAERQETGKADALKAQKDAQDKELAEYKGNADQKAKLEELHGRARVSLEAEINRDIAEQNEEASQRLLGLEAQHLQDKVKAQKLAVDQQEKADKKALEDEQLLYDQESDEWKRLEALKTAATVEANKQRYLIDLAAADELSQARQATILAGLSETEKAFNDGLRDMARQAQSKGVSLTQLIKKPENMASLVDMLGAGDLDAAFAGVNQMLTETNLQLANAKAVLGEQKEGTLDWYTAQQNVKNLTQEQAQLQSVANLSTDDALKRQLKAQQDALRIAGQITDEQEKLRAITDGLTNAVSNLASAFGEVGSQVSTAINWIGQAVGLASSVYEKFASMPKGKSFADILGNITDIKDVSGWIATAVGLVGQLVMHISEAGKAAAETKRRIENELYGFAQDEDLRKKRESIDRRKAAGENVVDDEREQVIAESRARIKKMIDDDPEGYGSFVAPSIASLPGDGKAQQAGMYVEIFGIPLYDRPKPEVPNDEFYDQKDRYRMNFNPLDGKAWKDKPSLLDESIPEEMVRNVPGRTETYGKIQEELAARKTKLDSLPEEQNKRDEDRLKAHMARMAQTKLIGTQLANDQVAEAEEEASQERQKIIDDYLLNLADLIAAGSDPEQLKQLHANFAALTTQADENLAKRKREIDSDKKRTEVEAEYRHLEHIENLKEDGFAKELALMDLASKKEQALLDADMLKYTAGSKEYIELEKQKADAVEAAEERKKKAKADNEKNRVRELANMREELAILQAKATDGLSDDLAAETRFSLLKLRQEQEDAEREAFQKYGHDAKQHEEYLTTLRQVYAGRRANITRDAEKQAIETVREDYEKDLLKKLDAQKKPIEASLLAEEKRLKALQKQSEELEKQLRLIDERYERELELFNGRDKGEFNEKKAKADLSGGMLAGIDYLANTNIKGDPLDRSSKKTQLRGLRELLDLQEQEATSKYQLEDLSETEFQTEMERIILLRAAATESALAEAKTEKEKADLRKDLAADYVKWQELQKDMIEAQRKAERKRFEQDQKNKETEIRQSQEKVSTYKSRLEDMDSAHAEHMNSIDAQIKGVTSSQGDWLQKVMAIAPAFGNATSEVLKNLSRLKQEFESAWNAAGISVGGVKVGNGETPLHSGGYNTPFYDSQGKTPEIIPMRNKLTTDKDGVFSVQGPDGNWYRTHTEMGKANRLPGYEVGGDIPDHPALRGDKALIRVSGGEKIISRQNAARLNSMLKYHEDVTRNQAITKSSVQHVNINVGNIHSDADLARFEGVVGQYMDKRDRRAFQRLGPNARRRG